MLKISRRSATRLVVLSGVFLAIGMLHGCSDGEANFKTTKMVAAAIVSFKHDHGAYPERLELLVPNYLTSIPNLGGSTKWRYAVIDDRKNFSLAFYSTSPMEWNGGCQSDGEKLSWFADNK